MSKKTINFRGKSGFRYQGIVQAKQQPKISNFEKKSIPKAFRYHGLFKGKQQFETGFHS